MSHWYARGGGIAKSGPYKSYGEASRALINTEGLPVPGAFVWEELESPKHSGWEELSVDSFRSVDIGHGWNANHVPIFRKGAKDVFWDPPSTQMSACLIVQDRHKADVPWEIIVEGGELADHMKKKGVVKKIEKALGVVPGTLPAYHPGMFWIWREEEP